jgi:hypothetical protein
LAQRIAHLRKSIERAVLTSQRSAAECAVATAHPNNRGKASGAGNNGRERLNRNAAWNGADVTPNILPECGSCIGCVDYSNRNKSEDDESLHAVLL